MSSQLADPQIAEVLTWQDFQDRFKWSQGEHLTVLGPTGNGKTTLVTQLLERQPWVVFFGTKPRDETLDKLRADGYRRIKEWRDRSPLDNRVLLWPDSKRLDSVTKQRAVFLEALDEIFQAGAWTIVFDEVLEFVEELKMPLTVKRFLRQGRSSKIAVVSGSQRPVDVPLLCYSQATHLFLWRTTDAKDTKRFSEISGNVDKRAIERQLMSLPDRHSFLYVNTRTGDMSVSRVELEGVNR